MDKSAKEFEAAQAKMHAAETEFKTHSTAFKKLIKEASKKFIAADKARAKARHDFRLARKAHLDAQDAAKIEANKAEVKS